jgi:hypothetical protein
MSNEEIPCICGIFEDECPAHPKPVEVPAEFKARLAELTAELERRTGPTMSASERDELEPPKDDLFWVILGHPWPGGAFHGKCPGCERVITAGPNSPEHAEHLRDAILAAGYRKPSPWIPADHHDGGGYKVADEKDIPWLLVNREWLLSEVKRLTPRTVTTVEELDALPAGSVVLGKKPWIKTAPDLYEDGGICVETTISLLIEQRGRGVTVLHVGGDR